MHGININTLALPPYNGILSVKDGCVLLFRDIYQVVVKVRFDRAIGVILERLPYVVAFLKIVLFNGASSSVQYLFSL